MFKELNDSQEDNQEKKVSGIKALKDYYKHFKKINFIND